jgi:hypothetical protein
MALDRERESLFVMVVVNLQQEEGNEGLKAYPA